MSNYISALPDYISISWTIQDVMRVVPEVNEDQARAILACSLYWHDPKVGITEDIIAYNAWMIFLQEEDEKQI